MKFSIKEIWDMKENTYFLGIIFTAPCVEFSNIESMSYDSLMDVAKNLRNMAQEIEDYKSKNQQ